MASLKKISEVIWELPVSYKSGMRVPARIYATEKLVNNMEEAVFDQISNVATLPGVARYAMACRTATLDMASPLAV